MNDEKDVLPIRICDKHQDEYACPTIFTFAFKGHDRWCPYCNNKMGLWQGEVKLVPQNDPIVDRYNKYRTHYKPYLRAHGLTYADGTMWEGKEIDPKDLPVEELERCEKLRVNGWKYGVRAEDL